MKEYVINENEAGQRFDKYLFKLLPKAPSGLIFKQLRNKNITLNNKKAKGSEILKENDLVKIFMADETIAGFSGSVNFSHNAQNIPALNVVYEDENILLADKPVGILSQKSVPSDISMNEMLVNHLVHNGFDEKMLATFRPAFCNRLDRNTSGLMIAGKSLKGLQQMSRLIKERTVDKYYLAVVLGIINKPDNLEGYLVKNKDNTVIITKEPVKDSEYIHTSYEPLLCNGELTLIKVLLITGKTHQIRAHLASIGHPVVGDPKYGNAQSNRRFHEKYQMLHSYELVFPKMDPPFDNISRHSFMTKYPDRFRKYFTLE